MSGLIFRDSFSSSDGYWKNYGVEEYQAQMKAVYDAGYDGGYSGAPNTMLSRI